VCGPGQIQNGYLGITEHDTYQSLRLGVSAQFMLTERLRLTADAAYIPAVKFTGEDNHNARQLVFPEWGNRGDGTMLEAILDYRVADGWNVGIGGRYWAWNMRTGTTGTIDLTPGAGPQPDQLQRFATERYGVFVQTSYRWGDTTASAVPVMPTKAPYRAAPMNWTGFYVGGHLGGGWSRDRWSDPFPTAAGNIAGFGDFTRANGPLAGGQIGADVQFGAWVLGVQADYAWADLHGENTCFSGLGGVNCQRVVNNLGTATVRVGYAWDRALAYVKGGGAWVGTTYDINANTGVLALGYGSTKVTRGGWTVGGGVEYALTDNWTTTVEYDHVDISSSTVPFPTVAVINAQSIAVKQWIDMLKVGVNYRFGPASVVAKY
jgi:opacity protein-like surface antigen